MARARRRPRLHRPADVAARVPGVHRDEARLAQRGLLERGLDRVSELLKVSPDASGLRVGSEITASEVSATIESALTAAEVLKRPVREINDIRQCLMSLSVRAEDAFYWRAAADWLEQLKRDSGLLAWYDLVDDDAGSRLRRALDAERPRPWLAAAACA